MNDPQTGPLTVILAEDSVLLRDGLLRVFEWAGMTVTATCGDGAALVQAVLADPPDVVVADVRMPPTFTAEGVQAALEIRTHHPQLPIMMLSQYVEEEYAAELISSPAGVGYLLKDRVSETGDFIAALRTVAAGGTALDPDVVAQLLVRARRDNPLARLTKRERQVLELMAQGKDNAAICADFHLTTSSVEKHIGSIFSKLGLVPEVGQNRRVMAVLTWLNQDR